MCVGKAAGKISGDGQMSARVAFGLMKKVLAVLFFVLSAGVFGHPGGGIIALSENSALIADPTENFIWLVEKGAEARRVVAKFHGHWMTRGRDGNVYVEAFGESGGAWSSAAFRLELATGKLTEIAHRDDLKGKEFAVDRDGGIVFQRGAALVSRKDGKETPFRAWRGEPKLEEVTALVWSKEGNLVFADRNRIWRVDEKGVVTLVGQIDGKVLEPKIWNGTETPSIFGLAIDKEGRVLATVPHLGKVFRIGKNQKVEEFAGSEDGWRATGVDVFGDTIFLMESDSRASTSPRVRILRGDGRVEILTVPRPAK
jgi:hypothetical protein